MDDADRASRTSALASVLNIDPARAREALEASGYSLEAAIDLVFAEQPAARGPAPSAQQPGGQEVAVSRKRI